MNQGQVYAYQCLTLSLLSNGFTLQLKCGNNVELAQGSLRSHIYKLTYIARNTQKHLESLILEYCFSWASFQKIAAMKHEDSRELGEHIWL